MTTPLASVSHPVDRPAGGHHRLLAACAGVNALSAWFGVLGLLGGTLSFGSELNARLPFDSLVLAGLALAAVVALPSTVLAVLSWRGDPRTPRATVLVGLLLIAWIVVQLVFLQSFSFFQPLYASIGLAFVLAGLRLTHRAR